MAWTLEQYNALCEAIATGARIVKYSDKEVTYNSLSEMMQLKGIMERALGLGKGRRKTVGQYDMGLGDRRRVPEPVQVITAGAVTQRVNRSVTVVIVAVPDENVLVLVGEKYIRGQYAPGDTLQLIEVRDGEAVAGGYLANKSVVMPVFKNNNAYQIMPFDSSTGTFTNAANGGFVDGTGDGGTPDVVTINFIDNVG